MVGFDLYPNVPFTVLQRKGTEGAAVQVANPKSHNCNEKSAQYNYYFNNLNNIIHSLKKDFVFTFGIFFEERSILEGLISR